MHRTPGCVTQPVRPGLRTFTREAHVAGTLRTKIAQIDMDIGSYRIIYIILIPRVIYGYDDLKSGCVWGPSGVHLGDPDPETLSEVVIHNAN
jgi:hypothetical protein